jgi:hypothetical protein
MAKFKVNCYYTYVGSVEVEADSIEEAYDKGYKVCEEMGTDDLSFVGYTDGEVIDKDGEIHEMC